MGGVSNKFIIMESLSVRTSCLLRSSSNSRHINNMLSNIHTLNINSSSSSCNNKIINSKVSVQRLITRRRTSKLILINSKDNISNITHNAHNIPLKISNSNSNRNINIYSSRQHLMPTYHVPIPTFLVGTITVNHLLSSMRSHNSNNMCKPEQQQWSLYGINPHQTNSSNQDNNNSKDSINIFRNINKDKHINTHNNSNKTAL
mmetsp:Transcript_18079/g.34490  ORF Transcript_18079/g.34490 Transcript_18079/m.34490 type:complete len:203 (-) Transcript_18079:89-697(-)